MADVQDIIDYYVGLLIIQYNNKPKARATIALYIQQIIASGILFDIRDGYSVDSAVGVQLDVVGKYVGVNRFFVSIDPINYFGLTFYNEVDPDSEDKFGFIQYATFDNYQYNGTLNYQSDLNQDNILSDEDFRTIIRLKILQNNINHSHKEINDAIFKIFGTSVIPDSTGNMKMFYFISSNFTAIMKAALIKGLLPKPMGVGITLVYDSAGDVPFFGFATYDRTPTNILGLTDYADYASNGGNILLYSQVAT